MSGQEQPSLFEDQYDQIPFTDVVTGQDDAQGKDYVPDGWVLNEIDEALSTMHSKQDAERWMMEHGIDLPRGWEQSTNWWAQLYVYLRSPGMRGEVVKVFG